MAEAGIDGGGLFREFLATVILEGFNPEAGFYKASPDQRIYPNSQAKRVTDSYLEYITGAKDNLHHQPGYFGIFDRVI